MADHSSMSHVYGGNPMIPISGHAKTRFEQVRAAFHDAFNDKPNMGASLAVRHKGKLVVDLWGGVADPVDSRPWEADTASVIFSCTKGITSLLVSRLVEQKQLDYDFPASTYWPDFAQGGKGGTPVRDLLSHRAGLSAPRVDMSREDILDWNRATRVLAEQEPLWEPGSGWAYHAITHGWLGGELIRRASGTSVGTYLASTLDGLDAQTWIGFPSRNRSLVARMVAGATEQAFVRQRIAEQSPDAVDWQFRAMTLGGALPPDLVGDDDHPGFNDSAIQAAEIPGAGGISTARSLATMWSATVVPTEGVRLLGDTVLDTALVVQSEGAPVFDAPAPWPRWGIGYQVDSEARRYLGPRSFGHDGAGGQVAFADRDHEIGFAFLTNQMESRGDLRATAIVEALRGCL
jgi:CubicO group peptidase (beta-lactamase class C family)